MAKSRNKPKRGGKRRGAGRPSLPSRERLGYRRLALRLSAADWERIEPQLNGQTLSDWARAKLLA